MKEKMKKLRKNHKGFSLVELIIVIAIMAILVGILAPQFIKYVNNSKYSSDVTSVDNAVQAYNAAVADNQGAFDGVITKTTDLNTALTKAGISDQFNSKSGTTADFKVELNADGAINKVVNGTEQVYPDANDAKDGYYTKHKK